MYIITKSYIFFTRFKFLTHRETEKYVIFEKYKYHFHVLICEFIQSNPLASP